MPPERREAIIKAVTDAGERGLTSLEIAEAVGAYQSETGGSSHVSRAIEIVNEHLLRERADFRIRSITRPDEKKKPIRFYRRETRSKITETHG